MELFRLNIPKAKLLKIPGDERTFFIQLTNFANDINILQKVIFYSSKETDDEIVRRAQNSQSLFFVRIQAGKLFEGWEFLKKNFFGTKLSKEYEEKLQNIGKNSLKVLKQYFGKKNLVSLIRNEFAFHYSPISSEKINQLIIDAHDSENFEIFMSEYHGNCFYYISYLLINSAILKSTNASNPEEAIDKLLKEIKEVTSCFLEFIGDCLIVIFKKHFGKGHTEIQIPDPPYVDEVTLPFFVRKKEVT